MSNYCANHPTIQSEETCTVCQKLYCDGCWVSLKGAIVCHSCAMKSRKQTKTLAGVAGLIGATAAAVVGYQSLQAPPPPPAEATIKASFIQQFIGATAGVRDIAFSPDKKWIASAGDDGSVRIWSTENGAATAVLRGAKKRLRAVTFAGEYIVAVGDDKLVHIWRRDQETPLASLERHASPIYDVIALPGSARFVTAGGDGQLLAWDAEKQVFLQQVAAEERGLRALAVSPNGDRFVVVGLRTRVDISQIETLTTSSGVSFDVYQPNTSTNKATTKIFDTQTLTLLGSVPINESSLRAVAFSPDGTRLVVAGLSKGVHEINLTTQEDKLVTPLRTATSLAYNDDGSLFISTESGEIYSWKDDSLNKPFSSSTRQPLWALSLFEGDLYFTGESSLISKAAPNLTTIDAKDFIINAHPGIANDLAFAKEGQLVVAGPSGAMQFKLGDKPTITTRYAATNARAVSASLDGSYIAFNGDCSQGCKIEVRQGLLAPAAAQGVKALTDAKINAEDFIDKACFLMQAQNNQAQPMLDLLYDIGMSYEKSLTTAEATTIAIFPPQIRDVEGFIKTLNLAFKEENISAVKLEEPCHSIRALGADTDRADTILNQFGIPGDPARRYNGAAVFSFNEPNGSLLPSYKGSISDIAFSPKELTVALASWGGNLRLFHAGSPSPLWELDGPDQAITVAAYSPNGSLLAVGHETGEIVLWETANNQKARSLFAVEGGATAPSSISFSPDGLSVVVTNQGTGIFRFLIENGELKDTYRGFFEPIKTAIYSPDGQWIIAASQGGNVKVFRAKGGEIVAEFKAAELISSMIFGPDQRLYISGMGQAPNRDNSVMVWSLQ
jgi:WD40 repeat protein